jgi:hypothetical protein
MIIVRKEMNLKEIKEAIEEHVKSGIIDDGLLIEDFSFEAPKILETFFESVEKNLYSITFYLYLPLNIEHKLAFFMFIYNSDLKELVKKSEVIDTRFANYVKYTNKKIIEIEISFTSLSNLSGLLVPLERNIYHGFFDLLYDESMGVGIFSVHVEDFLIDYTFYGKVL